MMRLARVGAAGGLQQAREVVDVDGLVLQEDVLVLVDGDDHALFGELVDGAGLGDGDFDAGLQHGRGEHEDEQKHEHDVDERRDVDVGERGLGASALAEKAMARRSSGGSLRMLAVRVAAGEHGGVLDGVEEFAAEVVHARGELAQARR